MKICKNPGCGNVIETNNPKRLFCGRKCKNKYSYVTNGEERRAAYQKYYDEVKNPKWTKQVICACGCGRTFEKTNRGTGKSGRKYYDTSCRGKTERKVVKLIKNVTSKCRYCGLDVVGEKSHKACRQIRKEKFLLELPCAMCGKIFKQTEYHQIYDPDCKIIADKVARKKYKLLHKNDPKPAKPPKPAEKKKRVQTVTARKAKPVEEVVARPMGFAVSGVRPMPPKSETKIREMARMDEVIIMAWRKADAHERKIIELHPLNKHLKFGE